MCMHRSPTIPNIGITGGVVLEEGMVFAIEPFATTGSGHVNEKTRVEIFSELAQKPVRIPSARTIMDKIRDRHGLPFSRALAGGEETGPRAYRARTGRSTSTPTRSCPTSLVPLSPSTSTRLS